MTVRTGYFAKIKYYQSLEFTPVSIARWTPKWFQGYTMLDLSPSAEMLKDYKSGELDEATYTEGFKDYLNHRQVNLIIERLKDAGDKIVLCCYEKPSDFCHRHIVANWLSNEGYECFELI